MTTTIDSLGRIVVPTAGARAIGASQEAPRALGTHAALGVVVEIVSD